MKKITVEYVKEQIKSVVKTDVFCQDCKFGGEIVENYLIDCNNEERNPKRLKVIANKKHCSHYNKRIKVVDLDCENHCL